LKIISPMLSPHRGLQRISGFPPPLYPVGVLESDPFPTEIVFRADYRAALRAELFEAITAIKSVHDFTKDLAP